MEEIFENVEDFFKAYIDLVQIANSEEYRLTPREKNFLVKCCIYNYEGNDLNDFAELSDYLLGIKFFSKKEDVSAYKYKLSVKKWIKTSRGEFILPGTLRKKKGDKFESSLTISYSEEVSN